MGVVLTALDVILVFLGVVLVVLEVVLVPYTDLVLEKQCIKKRRCKLMFWWCGAPADGIPIFKKSLLKAHQNPRPEPLP